GIVAPAKAGAAFLAYVFDKRVIDGAVNGLGHITSLAASKGRRVQTGLVRTYALTFLAGVVGVLLFLAVRS
ncbi:MAG TPA: NADH-quinone oxidoreductase subunit L, partial [Actinobacteria bacterium]|nr:NADH-quinone oxidoreductase subunit L [Actinomycetota bacterium]